MTVEDQNSREYREGMILAAALLHTEPPEDVHYICASTYRVLEGALKGAGLWDAYYEAGAAEAFHEADEKYPHVRDWYAALIELTRAKPSNKRLLKGAGNLDPVEPAGARYTACWLTPRGEQVARKFLARHAGLEDRMRQCDPPRKSLKRGYDSAMAYWLIKTEPSDYSLADLLREGETVWEGVKNAVAVRNLKAMKKGDEVMIYHTGKEKAVVGIAEVLLAKEGRVRIGKPKAVKRAVTLAEIKADKRLKEWGLVRIGRLSVVETTAEQWGIVIGTAEMKAKG